MKYRLFLNLEWIFNRFAYEQSVAFYDYEKHPVVTYRMDFLKQCLQSDFSVIDLGCGKGFISYLMANFAKKVVGIDYDKVAIQNAKLAYVRNNLEFHNIDAIDFLEKNTQKYNVLILSHILEHLDNPKEFLNRFITYFEFVYIELPDYDGSILNHFRTDQKMDLVYTDADHVSEFDRNELRAIFLACGLKELRAEFIFGIQRYWCSVQAL